MAELNFLPPKKVVLEHDKRVLSQLLIFTSAFLVLVVVVSGGIFLYSSYQDRQISEIKSENENIISYLEQNRSTAESLANIHSKVAAIKEIFSMKFEYSPVLERLFKIVPDGVGLKSVSITSKGEISAKMSASGSGALKEILAMVVLPENKFRNIEMSEISMQNKSPFDFGITMNVASDSANVQK